MIVTNFFEALQAGKELANAQTWKNAQLVTNKLTVVASTALGIAALFGYHIPLTGEQVVLLMSAIGVVVGMFNGTATVVSTTRVGLPARRNDAPPAGNDGGGDPAVEGDAGPDAGNDAPVPYLNQMDNRG